MALNHISTSRCCDGELVKFTHASRVIGLDMSFNVFFPKPLAELRDAKRTVPWLFFLSGLTCTEGADRMDARRCS